MTKKRVDLTPDDPALHSGAGVVHESPRGNWQAVVYSGDCTHPKVPEAAGGYICARAKDGCGASRGPDGQWRVIVGA